MSLQHFLNKTFLVFVYIYIYRILKVFLKQHNTYHIKINVIAFFKTGVIYWVLNNEFQKKKKRKRLYRW